MSEPVPQRLEYCLADQLVAFIVREERCKNLIVVPFYRTEPQICLRWSKDARGVRRFPIWAGPPQFAGPGPERLSLAGETAASHENAATDECQDEG